MAKRRRKDAPGVLLCKTVFEARYKPCLKFYALLIPAAEKLDEYPHWETDRLSVILSDPGKRCSLGIRHRRFGYDQDSDDVSLEEERLEKALNELPQALEISSYVRLGFRRQYLIPVKNMTFEELVAILGVKLFSQDERLTKIMPPQIDDLMYRVDSSDDSFRFRFTVGPIRKQEIPGHIRFSREHHLDPETREKDYLDIVQDYPDVAVLVDIDMFRQEEEIPTNEAQIFVKEARSRLENIVIHLRDYLFAEGLGD